MQTVANQIGMMFLLIACGLWMRKRHIMTDPVVKGMNSLILSLTWPMLMIATTQKDYTPESLKIFVEVMIAASIVMAVGLLAVYFIFRKLKLDTTPVMAMLSTMPNSGFFGIPIIQALYGDIGLLYLAAYIVGFNLVLWTIPLAMYSGLTLKSLKNLLNPGIIGAIVGMSLFLLQIRLPGPILGAVNQLSALNTPLSMLILGARMDALKLPDFIDRRLWLSISIKMIILPLLTLMVCRPLGMTGMTLIIVVGCTAMPTAASVQMMTEKYGGDVQLSAKGVSVSTLCSAVTLPLILYIAGLFA